VQRYDNIVYLQNEEVCFWDHLIELTKKNTKNYCDMKDFRYICVEILQIIYL